MYNCWNWSVRGSSKSSVGMTRLFILCNSASFRLEMCSQSLYVLWTLILALGAASGPSGPSAGPILPLPPSPDQQLLGKSFLEEMGRNGSSGVCSTWHCWPLAGNNFAIVKSVFSVVPCNFEGKRFCSGHWLGHFP